MFSRNDKDGEAFKEFDAIQLYCARCKQAVPVRKRLLLILPEGEKYEYLCAYCAATVGTKINRAEKPPTIIS
jgi:DNA-directed RNA polymerase subunit RPC12/RpoP